MKEIKGIIQPCAMEHVERYGEIYAEAFSGEPWNDAWTVEDATVHVRELLESKQAYGLEYVVDGQIAGFILGTSMLFHYGRTFEINDLAVARNFQCQGIASRLMTQLLADVKSQGMRAVHLITAAEGILPTYYEQFGFSRESMVILMGRDL